MIQLVDKRNRLEPKIFKISKLVKIQSHLYIKVTFGTTKHGHYRQVVAIQKHCKYWLLNKMVIIYRFSKKVSVSNRTWKLPWVKPTFYKVRRSCKQLNEVSRSGKAFDEVPKIWEQLYKVCRIRQRIYKVCGTRKQLFWSS